MRNLNQLLNSKLAQVPNSIIVLVLFVALLGFIDAGYLTVEHYKNTIPPCSVTGGCEVVLTSIYSKILGIPVSLLGSIFYLLILIGAFAYLESKNDKFLKWSLLLTIPGFIFALWFVYVQIFILHSYCIYCLVSFLTTTILFTLSMKIFAKYHEQ